MRLFVILSALMVMAATDISAQTYLQHLQEQKQQQGKVTVTEDKEIDELVNGIKKTNAVTPKRETAKTKKTTPTHTSATSDNTKKTTTEKTTKEEEPDTLKTDMHKKVMRRSYKIDGYRVQVFAGGNSRNDKIKAQQAGNKVKQAIPEQPVYVHFYSPRWICRVGNFRTFEEANSVLRQIQKLGYKEACIVSGKITVSY
ncbi:MAG: SPOR domain-containing protein [Prevotella sp.]